MSTERLSLDVIQIDSPCTENWDAMRGDECVRFCQGCQKHVFNLSAMTRPEAERVVCEAAGHLCVRFFPAEDGSVRTLEYRGPIGRRRGWRFWTAIGTCAAALVAGVNTYVLARGRPPAPAAPVMMGAMPAQMGGACAPPSRPTPAPAQTPPPRIPA